MNVLKHVREYALALTLAVMAAGAAGATWLGARPEEVVVAPTATSVIQAPAFAPISHNGLRFVTPGPYHVGQVVTVQNGICNTSTETVQMITIVGYEETRLDKLAARNLVIIPKTDQGQLGVTPLPRPMEPGCIGLGPLTGPLPSELKPGYWRLYVVLQVMGTQSGQVQRLSIQSDEIEVID